MSKEQRRDIIRKGLANDDTTWNKVELQALADEVFSHLDNVDDVACQLRLMNEHLSNIVNLLMRK